MNLSQKIPKPDYKETFIGLKKFAQTQQAHSFAWLSLTLFTISFFAIVAIRPTLVTIAKLTREIKEKKGANKSLEAKVKTLVAAQAVFVKNSGNLALLEEAFPEKNQFAALAFFFDQKAQTNFVNIKSFSFDKISLADKSGAGKTEIPANIPFFTFSITVTGEYFNLKTFLADIESSPRIISVDTSSVNPIKNNNNDSEEVTSGISLSITGKAFFEQK